MKPLTCLSSLRARLCLSLLLSMAISCTVTAESLDPEQKVEKQLWTELYPKGGKTFYCKKNFRTKTPLLTEGYIYSKSWVRDHLKCGTSRRCIRDSEHYRNIISDLHNVVPTEAYLEFKRKNLIFGLLDSSVKANDCGMRKKFQLLEPPDDIKGDIARVIYYMHWKYDLPLKVAAADLEMWNRQDPPGEQELERNNAIKRLQGNANPFIEKPDMAAGLNQ